MRSISENDAFFTVDSKLKIQTVTFKILCFSVQNLKFLKCTLVEENI